MEGLPTKKNGRQELKPTSRIYLMPTVKNMDLPSLRPKDSDNFVFSFCLMPKPLLYIQESNYS